jgi:hypothetical protein
MKKDGQYGTGALPKNTTDGRVVGHDADPIMPTAKQADQGNRFSLAAFPADVQTSLKAFDHDGDGSVNKTELAVAAKMYSESKEHGARMRKIIVALSTVMFVMLVAIMGLTFMVVEISKENHTGSDGAMTVKGDASQVVRTDSVESFTTLWDIPAFTTETISYMKQVNMYIKMTGYTAEATFKVAGAYKPAGSKDTVVLETPQGYTITINRAGRNGIIVMGNKGTFNVYSGPDDDDVGRRLSNAAIPEPVLLSKEAFRMSQQGHPGKWKEDEHAHGRLLNDFSGGLITSGSFTMMSAGGA